MPTLKGLVITDAALLRGGGAGKMQVPTHEIVCLCGVSVLCTMMKVRAYMCLCVPM